VYESSGHPILLIATHLDWIGAVRRAVNRKSQWHPSDLEIALAEH